MRAPFIDHMHDRGKLRRGAGRDVVAKHVLARRSTTSRGEQSPGALVEAVRREAATRVLRFGGKRVPRAAADADHYWTLGIHLL